MSASSSHAGPAGAELTLSDCRLEHPEQVASFAARCGKLEVAEDPARPGARRIRLKVAVVPALNPRGPGDPLFVLAGGPGQAASEFYAAAAGALGRIQRERDIVLVDQRGTGGSNALDCEFPEEEELADMTPLEIRAHAESCLASLQTDPRFYTTSVAVRDLDAVRAALGYERINLYGVSYGTRVAQHYVRRFPERVRSVILDGVVPTDVALVADGALQAQRALDLIFARCRSEATCFEAFRDPAASFASLRAALEHAPATVTMADPVTGTLHSETIRAVHLQAAARFLSYSPDRAALLPLLLHEGAGHGRNVEALALLLQRLDARGYGTLLPEELEAAAMTASASQLHAVSLAPLAGRGTASRGDAG